VALHETDLGRDFEEMLVGTEMRLHSMPRPGTLEKKMDCAWKPKTVSVRKTRIEAPADAHLALSGGE